MPILSTTDYPAIRSAVGFWVTEDLLPDEILGQSIFVPDSEMEIKRSVPDAETFTGDKEFYVKNAVIYWTAYKLVFSFPQLIDNTILSDRWRYQEIDLETKLNFLLRQMNKNLIEVGVEDTAGGIRVFNLGNGYKEALYKEAKRWGYYDMFPLLYRYDEYVERNQK